MPRSSWRRPGRGAPAKSAAMRASAATASSAVPHGGTALAAESARAVRACSRVVQDRILSHVDTSVRAIYDQQRYDAEARTWLQQWADPLKALTVSNVVPLRAA